MATRESPGVGIDHLTVVPEDPAVDATTEAEPSPEESSEADAGDDRN